MSKFKCSMCEKELDSEINEVYVCRHPQARDTRTEMKQHYLCNECIVIIKDEGYCSCQLPMVYVDLIKG
jgi:hypothetical protein